VRDGWEAEKEPISTKVASLLGETYSLEVDMNTIYPYAGDGYAKDRPGDMTKNYFEGFLYQLENYVQKYGDDGKATFNNTVTAKKITLEVDDTGKVSYCGCDIKDGRFRILAGENYLATNISDACYHMLKAVEEAEASAGGSGLSVGAKANVKETVDKEFPTLEKQFAEILGTKITLDANLEANYAKLRPESGFNDAQLGKVTVAYLEGFAYQLNYLKFKGDEMMQEAFQEACDKSVIRVEVVETLKHGSYNDVIFEDGVCKLQVSNSAEAANRRPLPIIGIPMWVILGAKLSIVFEKGSSRRSVSWDL